MVSDFTVTVDNFEKYIKDMIPGESGFAVPWALSFDQSGRAYLKTNQNISKERGGTVTMEVKKKSEEEYEIDTRIKDYEWKNRKEKSDIVIAVPDKRKKPLLTIGGPGYKIEIG